MKFDYPLLHSDCLPVASLQRNKEIILEFPEDSYPSKFTQHDFDIEFIGQGDTDQRQFVKQEGLNDFVRDLYLS